MVKKKDIIVKRQAYAIKLDVRIGDAKIKLHATEEWAIFATTQVIEEYKKSKNFLQEVAEGSAEAYQLKFANYKEKVTQIYPQLDLSKITADGEFEGEEEANEEETANAEEVTTEAPVIEVVAGVLTTDITKDP